MATFSEQHRLLDPPSSPTERGTQAVYLLQTIAPSDITNLFLESCWTLTMIVNGDATFASSHGFDTMSLVNPLWWGLLSAWTLFMHLYAIWSGSTWLRRRVILTEAGLWIWFGLLFFAGNNQGVGWFTYVGLTLGLGWWYLRLGRI